MNNDKPLYGGLRIFPKFNTIDNCPICNTNEDKPCVLIPIEGTEDGYNVEAKPVHCDCIKDKYGKSYIFIKGVLVISHTISDLFPEQFNNINKGKCVTCGGEVGEFRDALSKREYEISKMCQKCQDKTFG
jgi:hypothetical protein